MGRQMADALGGELDVIPVSKLGAPGDPERAIGSVDDNGEVVLVPKAHRIGYTRDWLERERDRRLEALQQRARLYRGSRPAADPGDRNVIVVDDGAATGATLMAALRLLRGRAPASLSVALAVAPRRVVRQLRAIADEVVCLYRPWFFVSVNQVFRRFEQVNDDTVVACLEGRR
jgi:predicted phosphoribosyltransferase